jgi:type IV secretory pathway component VirB8
MKTPCRNLNRQNPLAAYVLILAGVVAALQIGKLPLVLPEISEALA